VLTPPENKTSAASKATATAPAAESPAPEVENVTFDAVAAEEPADGDDDDVSDVVDTIKNGNNVVAFLCKYRNFYFIFHSHSY
jgi:hypothetical protein